MLTWDQRLGRWANVGTVAGIVVTALVWGVGWLFNIPWWVGLLLGLVAWVIVLNTLVALGRRATPAAEITTATPAQANNDPSPTPPQTEPEEVEQLRAQVAEKDQRIDELYQQLQRKDMEDEHGAVDWGSFPARQIPVEVDAAPLRAENNKLREELHQTKEELEVSKAGERRKRIEKWRAEIQTNLFARHPLGGSLFAQTETYSEMRPHLPPNVRQRFESQYSADAMLPTSRNVGREGDRRVLLEELARIEKEWGVI